MTHQGVRKHNGPRPEVPPRVGRFTHHPLAGTWTWDDEVFRIHGLPPGAIAPTTDYVIQCKHPEDRDRVAGVLVRAATTGEPFSVAIGSPEPTASSARSCWCAKAVCARTTP